MTKYIYINLFRKQNGDFISYGKFGEPKSIKGRKIVWENLEKEIDKTIIEVVMSVKNRDAVIFCTKSRRLIHRLHDRYSVDGVVSRYAANRQVTISCMEA